MRALLASPRTVAGRGLRDALPVLIWPHLNTIGLDSPVWMLIRKYPGIQPSEINRRLNLEQSDGLLLTLIKRGLIRKERDGVAVRYYPL
jgi:hypothetical protein